MCDKPWVIISTFRFQENLTIGPFYWPLTQTAKDQHPGPAYFTLARIWSHGDLRSRPWLLTHVEAKCLSFSNTTTKILLLGLFKNYKFLF